MNIPLRHQLWRAMMTIFHRTPIHPGWRHPLRFYEHGCVLCRDAFRRFGHVHEDALADQSSITLSEPEYDDEGNIVRRGVVMTATARRQIDEIAAGDPAVAKAIADAIGEIRDNP